MSNSPIYFERQKSTRKAKVAAKLEIKKYYRPKYLQDVPEYAELFYTKEPMRVVNNNTEMNRNFKQLSLESKYDEKKSINEAKMDKQNARKWESNGMKQNSKSHSSKNSLSDDIIVLDSPMASKNSVIVLNSSIANNNSVYGFDALQTDDSTDEEIDITVSESKQPYWSLYNNRIAIVIDQMKVRMKVIDKLFGSGPETVASQEIFPFKTPIRRRRSTAIWNTPPRYSILPKY